MAKVLTLTKKEIEARTLYYIERLGAGAAGRDAAASVLGNTRRAIESWCEPADPRVIPADKLMSLVIEVHFRELYVSNHIKIIDIYDDCDDLIGCTNRAPDALFLADVHCGRIAQRLPKHEFTAWEIVLSEEQKLRSRLRKVVASGKIPVKQICRTLGCDEYVLIDMQSEVAQRCFGRMPNPMAVEILESFITSRMGVAA